MKNAPLTEQRRVSEEQDKWEMLQDEIHSRERMSEAAYRRVVERRETP